MSAFGYRPDEICFRHISFSGLLFMPFWRAGENRLSGLVQCNIRLDQYGVETMRELEEVREEFMQTVMDMLQERRRETLNVSPLSCLERLRTCHNDTALVTGVGQSRLDPYNARANGR